MLKQGQYMTTTTKTMPAALTPTWLDQLLAGLSAVMLAFITAALLRGMEEWARLPANIWFHIVTIIIALSLTPIMLLRFRGDRLHRTLGYIWLVSMVSTALVSFTMRSINQGAFSFIHILSVVTLYVCYKLVRNARAHDPIGHRREVRGIVMGALMIAGFFTFQFDRLMGRWFMGLPAFN